MKKLLLLSLCALSLFCAQIQTINAQTVWDGTADVSWYDESQTDFYIYTAEELAGLASLVNNSTSNFSGKTIHLEADIWLNYDDDNTNNWIKIGGCTQSSGEISGTIKAFSGTFHGGGHIIYNMYCNNSGYFQAGLFGNLQYPGSIDSLILINPVTISNGMMGALVAFIGNNSNSGNGIVNISECMVINEQVQGVNTSSNNNVGGLVGAAYPNKQSGGYCTTNIQHCLVTGSITGQYVGGICGNSQGAACSNCYFAGTISSSYATGGICGYSGTVSNCFSTFSGSNSSGNGTTKTLAYMQSNAFLSDLDNHFKYDFCDYNDGLPVLTWLPCENDPDCGTVSEIQFTNITGSSAMVSWSASPYGTPMEFILEYTIAGEENWESVYAESNSYLLSGLEPSTEYEIRIMTNCEEGSSDYQTSGFTTRCLVDEEFAIGNGTGTNYQFPVNNYYNYTYSQQIFTAEELGNTANSISGISFQYGYSSPSTAKNDVNIYLGHTSKSSFASGSDYEVFDSLQLVYSGALNCTQGWNRFDFDTPFEYNGINNLIVAVDDNSGHYNNSSYVFNTHSTSGYMTISHFSDSDNQDPANPSFAGTNYNSRNNVKIHYCAEGTCAAPSLTVTNTDANSVEIEWTPGYQESTWELRYKATSETDWIDEGYVYGNSYSLYSLSPNTHYTVQLRAICDEGYESSWTSVNFKTECGPISSSDLPWSTNFDEEDYSSLPDIEKFPDCWNKLTSDASHFPYVYSGSYHSAPNSLDFHYTPNCYDVAILPALGDDVDASSLMLTFYLIKSSTSAIMEIGVMDDKDDITTFEVLDTLNTNELESWEYIMYPLSNYIGYGKYIAFRVSNGNSSTYRIDDLSMDFIPSCLQPLNVTISNIDANSATIAWTDANDASSWIIEYDTTGFTPGSGLTALATSNPFELTGLDNSYTYDVYVIANCSGGDYSDYSEVRTFTTEICSLSDQCEYTFNLHDSYGDGWNGNSISVYSNNILVGTYTIPSGNDEASYSVGLCDMSNVSLVWTSGSYAYETSFEILDPSEETIYSCTDGSTLTSGVSFTNFTVSCSAQTCLKPTDLAATNITTNSMDLSWTARNGESSWDVVYGPANFDPETSGTTVNVTNTPNTTLGGLNSNTTYDIYVKAYCDIDAESIWSNKITVTTECELTTYPFSENFDGGTMPNCWTQNIISNTHVWEVVIPSSNPSSAYSGSYAARFKTSDRGSETEFISPMVDMTSAISPVLSFWYVNQIWSSDQDQLSVYYRASFEDSWTLLAQYNSNITSWTNVTLPLPEGLSSCQICFRGLSDYGYGIYLDNISINENGAPEPEECDVPTGLTASNVEYNSVLISWNAGNANEWNLQYKAQGGSWIAVNHLTSPSYNLTGLTAQTSYEVQVQAVCTDNVSDWTTSISFTTSAAPVDPCEAPTDLQIGGISETSAVASWNANGGSDWKIGYKQQSASNWQEFTISTTSYNIEGLNASTTYDFRVKTICEENESEFVSTSFTTTGVGIDNNLLANSISLMPNPADNHINLSIEANINVKEAAIFNAFGQLIQTITLSDNHCTINLENYASGMYFIRIANDNAVATKKFIKK